MLDITPKNRPVRRILFLPDPGREYTGVQVDNIRKPLRKDPAIRRYLDLFHELLLELNKGDLAYQHGPIEFSGEDARRIRGIQQEMFQLEETLTARYGR